MNEKLIELLEEIQKNEELQEKIRACNDINELYAVTTQYVDGYTIDELKTGLAVVKSNLSDELSDEELDMVAGGSKNSSVLELPVKVFNDVINFAESIGDALERWLT